MTFSLTPAEVATLSLSLKVAVACVAFTLPAGMLLGWLLARRDFPGRAVVNALVHLPLVLPPVVVGYVLLLILGRASALGRWFTETWGIHIAFTGWAAVLASAVVGFPLLVRPIRLAIELVDRRMEAAARTLGAGRVRTFVTITLPLATPGILTGMLLCFARSLGEFGATITFAGNIPGQTRTLPLAIFTHTQVPGGDAPAARLVLISVVVSLIAMLLSELLARRLRRRLGHR